MGIGLKNQSWNEIVAKTRSNDQERVKKQHLPSRLETPVLPAELRSKIKTSQKAEEWIAAHRTRTDNTEFAHQLVSSERGKRRNEKKGK